MVLHDARLNRTTNGRGRTIHYRAEELAALDAGYFFRNEAGRFSLRGQGIHIPRLEQILQEFPQTTLAIELKDIPDSGVQAVLSLIQRFRAEGRVILGSEHHAVNRCVARQAPHLRRFFSRRDVLQFYFAYRTGRQRPREHGRVASLPTHSYGLRLDSPGWIDFLHAHGVAVYFWTIDRAEDIRRLANCGADGLVTNRPDIANSILDRPRGTAPTNE